MSLEEFQTYTTRMIVDVKDSNQKSRLSWIRSAVVSPKRFISDAGSLEDARTLHSV